ncbi:MAG TPA: type II toxin-antitoxin system HigB family toxin [Bradyrhizobium sp.]|nr:type II toxin-antitoxin system HigB family toxin [Bradyrhizobium sp.]
MAGITAAGLFPRRFCLPPLAPFPFREHTYAMRIIAWSVLSAYADRHPETKIPFHRWRTLVKAADWSSMDDVRLAAPNAKILNGERARFEIAGGNFRMIVAFDFRRRIVFIKFVGTHAEYDRIDALTVSIF